MSDPASEPDAPLVYSETTPSGVFVEYEAKPKRLYRVNGIEVPSVTSVLGCLSKDGLSWWGMKIGVQGVLDLFDRDKIGSRIDWNSNSQQVVTLGDDHVIDPATVDSLTALLTAEKLTVNHVLKDVGNRGTNVHSAFEAWARSGGEFAPTPQNFSVGERPYVEGFLWWLDTGGTAISPMLCEIMVGSEAFGFAGRYDLVIEVTEPVEFISKSYKKRDNKTVVVAPGRYLVDLKTSSGVYKSHFLQLAGYELASVEGGYQATDGQFVLHVTKNGEYEFVPSKATGAQFLAVKQAYDALKELPS